MDRLGLGIIVPRSALRYRARWTCDCGDEQHSPLRLGGAPFSWIASREECLKFAPKHEDRPPKDQTYRVRPDSSSRRIYEAAWPRIPASNHDCAAGREYLRLEFGDGVSCHALCRFVYEKMTSFFTMQHCVKKSREISRIMPMFCSLCFIVVMACLRLYMQGYDYTL